MLLGLVIIGEAADTYLLSELLANPPTGGAVPAGLVLVLLGAFTKSAQFPFGSWLPGAMVAPTPISAYLHSATMVKAGVYLVARLAPIFAAVTVWRPLVLVVGSVTMIVGGLRALRQHDLKLLLAYGTVSQLGFLMLLLGTGAYKIAQAGVVLLLAHGAFKAALFMVVGIVDHELGTRDVRAIPRLAGPWRPVQVIAVVSAASMAGLPPLLGFIAKEKAFAGYEVATFGGADVVLAVIVVGSILTFTYSARFVLGVLGRLEDDEHRLADAHPHDPPVAFWAPAAVLTVFTVVAGVAPVLIDALVQAATIALDPSASPSDVVLWAGFGLPVVLSIVVVAVGTLLVVARRPVADVQRRLSAPLAHLPTTEQAFLSGLKGTTAFATGLTARVQHGSLPLYLAVVITTVLVLPVAVLVGAGFEWPELVDAAVQVPLVAIIVGGAVGAALMRRRIAAALMLGAIGYAMAGLYIVQGAPDLALTQLAIETLFTVLFVLVLRFLPPRFVDRTPVVVRSFRLGASLLVGAAVFVMMLVAASGRDDVAAPNVSQEMIERSAPEAKGNNVTNVILVDFRGLDTLGEIAVLLVAAVGAVGLARLGRRRRGSES
jgi:multicomponent Na+:H+ antiporter subunit A